MNSAERQYRLVQLLGHRFNGINAVAFSPDGKSVAGGGSDALILIWQPATAEFLRTLEGHEASVTSLAFNPDGRWLASGSDDRSVRLWEPARGKLVRALEGYEGRVTSPDGQWLASGSDDRSVRLWEAATGKLLRTLEGGHEGRGTTDSFAASIAA